MNYEWAVKQLKEGKRVRKACWPATHYLEMSEGSPTSEPMVMAREYVQDGTPEGTVLNAYVHYNGHMGDAVYEGWGLWIPPS